MSFLAFLISLITSLILVPFVRWVTKKSGRVAKPRQDRWHSQPTPNLGGIAIFASFALAVLITGLSLELPWGLLIGSGLAFLLGVIDDLRHVSPQTKLVGLFLAASAVVLSGYTTAFFPWPIANIAVSFIWLVGLANALNLLDNMDGLAGGTALIVSGFLAYFFWRAGSDEFLLLALALAGAIMGFLVFNFPPASIFMGDGGSLFLGLTLSSLAIARQPQASNVFAVVGIPTLIFLLPILDTAMVSLTRLLRGQSPAQGGRDHTSHRLVALGLSERQTLLVLLAVALGSGITAVVLEAFSYSLSLILIPSVMLIFVLFTAYLGQLKVVEVDPAKRKRLGVLTNWVVDLTYRRRVLEVLLDFFLIAFSYYLAHLIQFEIPLEGGHVDRYIMTLPLTIASMFGAFFLLGVYRGVWRYISFGDALRFFIAILAGGSLSSLVVRWVYTYPDQPNTVFILYGILMLFLMIASRFSFRLLERVTQVIQQQDDTRILIYGAGEGGTLALRECQQNLDLGFKPIGFLDDDPLKKRRSIYDLTVLGSLDDLDRLIDRHNVQGIIIASVDIVESGAAEKAIRICKQKDVWVRRMRLEFDSLT
jgi:UDP-GlcNAc:undecaprenyl-phosphate GlcNAc-1-phosphate transferase